MLPIRSIAADFDYGESAKCFGWKCLFCETMPKMEYIWKCNFLVLKTVCIMTLMVHCGCTVEIAIKLAIFII